MNRRLSTMVVVAAAACSVLASAGPVANAGGADPVYYLALGDSLSVGFHPAEVRPSEGTSTCWHVASGRAPSPISHSATWVAPGRRPGR